MVELDQYIDGLALYFQVRVQQYLRHFFDGDVSFPITEGIECGAAYELVRVAELHLERPVDFVLIEFRQQPHNVNLDCRVLAAHAVDQVGNHIDRHHIFDDCEKRRLLFWVQFIGALHEIMHAQILFMDLKHLDQRGL